MTESLETDVFESAVSYSGPSQVRHFMDHLTIKSQQHAGIVKFRSSFDSFDQKLEGLETGEVVVVSGKTKNGKTLFAESWIHGIMTKDPTAKALFLSFEVQTVKLLMKYQNKPDLPIYVPDQLETMNFEWLKERCLEAKLKYECKIVLIDHLHFMVDMDTRQNMSLNIGGFMRRLKHEIAKGFNMAVILIAHQGQSRKDTEASVDGIRDSSFVAQEADSVIVVSRQKNPEDLLEYWDKLSEKIGPERATTLRDKIQERMEAADIDDKYSAGLATVSIERARRAGTYEWKKTFQKNGEFLTEL